MLDSGSASYSIKSPLLKKSKRSSPKTKAAQAGLQVFLALASGAGSAILFLEPSKAYAKSSVLGKWLGHYVNPSWPIFFASGAAEFGATNIFLAFEAIPAFIQYLNQQENTSSAVLKGSGIILFALTQNVQPILISYATGGSLLELICADIGTFPGTLYATMGIIQQELPRWQRLLKKLTIFIREHTLELYFTPTEENLALRSRYKEHERLYQQFIQRLQAGWLTTLNNRENDYYALQSLSTVDCWSYLTNNLAQQNYYQESWPAYLFKLTCKGLGLLLASDLLSGILLNTRNVLSHFLPNQYLINIITSDVSLYIVYLMAKFLAGAFGGIAQAIINIWHGQPIDFLAWQNYPKFTLGFLIGSTIISSASYPTALNLFLKNYGGEFKTDFSYGVIAGIVLYHIIGSMKLLDLFLEKFGKYLGDETTRSIIKLYEAYKVALQATPAKIMTEKLMFADNTTRSSLLGESEETIATLNNSQTFSGTFKNYISNTKSIFNTKWTFSWCCLWRHPAEREEEKEEYKTFVRTPSTYHTNILS